MTQWSKQKVDASEINNGNEYDVNDALSLDAINAIVNNSLYASEYVSSDKITIDISSGSGTITQEQATALEQDNVIVTRTYGSFTDIYKKWYTYTDGKSIVYYVPSNTGSINYVTFNTNLLTWATSTRYVKNTGIYGTETAGQVLTSDGNNGTEWTTLEVSGGVTSIGGSTGDITLGDGLSIENNQLSATANGGVTSISGVTGNILLGENLSITDNILYVDIAKYVTATEEQINSIFEEEN